MTNFEPPDEGILPRISATMADLDPRGRPPGERYRESGLGEIEKGQVSLTRAFLTAGRTT